MNDSCALSLPSCHTLPCHPPPPGSPRAYNIPDRFHPEEDGAEPRVRQTVLQQHVEFFDYVGDRSLSVHECALSVQHDVHDDGQLISIQSITHAKACFRQSPSALRNTRTVSTSD